MKKLTGFLLILSFMLFLSCIFCGATGNYGAYRCVKTDKKVVCLTFDDGPHPEYTEKILDILKKYEIKATFFVVGENAEKYPEIVKREKQEGHEIGNHTKTHVDVCKTTAEKVEKEILQTHDIINGLCDYEIKLIRPPGGALSQRLKNTADMMDYKIILWNVDTRDWAHSSVDSIYLNVEKNCKNGSIILFHDYISGKSPTVDALEKVIPFLKKEGYEFLTVSELCELEEKTVS